MPTHSDANITCVYVRYRLRRAFQVREIETGRVVYSEEDSVDVPMVTTTSEGQLLVAFYDGSRLVKVVSVCY